MSCHFSFFSFKSILLFLNIFFFSCATHKTSLKTATDLPRGPIVQKIVSDPGKKLSFLSKSEQTSEDFFLAQIRKEGLIPIPVKTLPQILKELKNDNPVVFFSDPQKAMTLTGYELRDEILFLDSQEKKKTFFDFMKDWEKSGYLAYAVAPPSQLRGRDLALMFEEAVKIETLAPMEAKYIYRELIELDGHDPRPYLKLASLTKSPVERLKLREKAVRANPNDQSAWRLYIKSLKRSGRKKVAAQTSKKVSRMFSAENASPKKRLSEFSE